MAHKAHVKEAMFSTNRKDWEIQIMSVHARKDAIIHQTKLMIGNLECIYEVLHFPNMKFLILVWLEQRMSPEWTRGRIASKRGWIGAISRRENKPSWTIGWVLRGGSNFSWKSRGQVRFVLYLDVKFQASNVNLCISLHRFVSTFVLGWRARTQAGSGLAFTVGQ